MKCVVPSINIKAFSRAINSLSKVGDELYVEPSRKGISFRTVNISRSAFASFFLKENFFSQFELKTRNLDSSNDVKCKVSMKACLNAFKSINGSDKLVEKCRIEIDSQEDRMIVMLSCRFDITKTYSLSFIECETIQAVFNRDQCTHSITTQSRILQDTFSSFHSIHEEVTLAAKTDRLCITNYLDDAPDPVKAIHTELTLESGEFDKYAVKEDSEVTFCLREMKALLIFTEPISLPITINFSTAGNPLICSVESGIFDANFVLATLGNSLKNSQSSEKTVINQQNTVNGPLSEQIDLARGTRSEVSLPTPLESVHRQKGMDSSTKQRQSIERVSSKNTSCIDLTDTFSNPAPDLEEDLLQSPPSKRPKFLFQRCFEPTFNASKLPGFQTVYAEDSDEES